VLKDYRDLEEKYLLEKQTLFEEYKANLTNLANAYEIALQERDEENKLDSELQFEFYERELTEYRENLEHLFRHKVDEVTSQLSREAVVEVKDLLERNKDVNFQFSEMMNIFHKHARAVEETKEILQLVESLINLQRIQQNSSFPFESQYSSILKFSQNDPLLKASLSSLSRNSISSGIKTLRQLQDEFSEVETKAIQPVKNGFFPSLFSSPKPQIPIGLMAGDDKVAILARAKYYLFSHGNISNAIKELQKLPSSDLEICTPWVEKAKQREQLDQVVMTFQARTQHQIIHLLDEWKRLTPKASNSFVSRNWRSNESQF